jgi:hypothetical protein
MCATKTDAVLLKLRDLSFQFGNFIFERIDLIFYQPANGLQK